MNELFKELAKVFAREVALQLADMVTKAKPGAEDVGKAAEAVAPAAGSPTTAEVFKPDVTAERSESEWRADCLAIINVLAPTHGKQLRALLAKFEGAKRLSDVKADALPSLLAELASLQHG